MLFLNFFRTQLPKILRDFKISRLELTKIQHDLERLLIMEQNYASKELTNCQYGYCIKTAIDTFGVALWVKDADHRFLFVNRACCHNILKCSEEEALNLTDIDFKDDALSTECIKSDKKVMSSRKTMRFIEHAVYPDGKEIFLDIVKSPRIEDGEVIGTIGSGVVITNSIPKGIRDQHRLSNSIEIALDAAMGTRKLVELIERRKNGKRNTKDDSKFQKFRKTNAIGGVSRVFHPVT